MRHGVDHAPLSKRALGDLIAGALAEDIGPGDVTTQAALTGREGGTARAVAKADLIVAGIEVFRAVFQALDGEIHFADPFADGQRAQAGDTLAKLSGRLASILTAERVALNLLQRMCGIATLTGRYVAAVEGTKARILDTRKTAPGLRLLDKYAVRVGGGFNHRFALYDGVLIKDNHIAAAGGISQAIRRVRHAAPHTLKIEVEVKSLPEVEEALAAGADVLMLDNMALPEMKASLSLIGGRIPVEASGNVTLETVRLIAETGVDFISVGALTHSAPAADISLLVDLS